MGVYTRHVELTPALGKIAALLMASLLPALSAGCAQQTAGRPALLAQAALRVAAPPRAVPPMKILMTQTGDVATSPVNGNNQPLQDVPGHQSTKEHTYNFGPAGSGADVCFWDNATPAQQYCWPNTASAWIFLNPQGFITGAQQASGQTIHFANRNAVVTKNWFYGHDTPWCFWSPLGCYCWDV